MAGDRVTHTFKRSILFLAVAWHSSLRSDSGSHLAPIESMPDLGQLGVANIIGNLIFGSIGFVAFVYGRKQSLWTIMFIGLGLMVFPYFIGNTAILFAAGTLGTGLLFLCRE